MSNDFDRIEFTPRRHISVPGGHWFWNERSHTLRRYWDDQIRPLFYQEIVPIDSTPGITANHIAMVISLSYYEPGL